MLAHTRVSFAIRKLSPLPRSTKIICTQLCGEESSRNFLICRCLVPRTSAGSRSEVSRGAPPSSPAGTFQNCLLHLDFLCVSLHILSQFLLTTVQSGDHCPFYEQSIWGSGGRVNGSKFTQVVNARDRVDMNHLSPACLLPGLPPETTRGRGKYHSFWTDASGWRHTGLQRKARAW